MDPLQWDLDVAESGKGLGRRVIYKDTHMVFIDLEKRRVRLECIRLIKDMHDGESGLVSSETESALV